MIRTSRYLVIKDERGVVVDLIRFVNDDSGLCAERYTEGQWVAVPSLTGYLFELPPDSEMVSEEEAFRVLRESGSSL